jgi:putative transposase
MEFYQRKLPHYQPAEATFFITFRLAGSIPKVVLNRMRTNYDLVVNGIIERQDLTCTEQRELLSIEQKKLFATTDNYLDNNPNGPYYLQQNEIADIVSDELHRHDTQTMTLWAFCIMSNHVHLLCTLLEDAPVLTKVLQNIKSYSAQKANRVLGREGQFWERESYDHVVRKDGDFERILRYILMNPVKAGLVDDWMKWRNTYLRPT